MRLLLRVEALRCRLVRGIMLRLPIFLSGSCFLIALAASAAEPQSSTGNLLIGDTSVKILRSYLGIDPLPRPDKIRVFDFRVSPEVVEIDESAAARLQRRRLQRTGSGGADSPETIAQQVLSDFASVLVTELQKTPITAVRSMNADAPVEKNTLIVYGEFTSIDQGNKSKRIMIGFGRGASDVQAHVTVSLMTTPQPILVSEFNLKSESGKKPGAAATMGTGSAAVGAAAGSAGDTRATVEADASRMAKAVAKQVEELMTSQKWIPAQQPGTR